MATPSYDITIDPFGSHSEIRVDGTLVPGLFRVELIAAVSEPTRLILHQHCGSHIVGGFGDARIVHDCADCKGHDPAGG